MDSQLQDSSVFRTCYVCKKELSIALFTKHRQKRDGYSLECKSCLSIRVSRWKKENLEKCRANDRESENTRMKNGLCKHCVNIRLDNHKKFCEKHWYIQAAQGAFRKGTVVLGKALHQKMIDQNYTCPYTGEKLIPGVNAHLDHIYPRFRFPELATSLDNVEWVSETANLAKRVMTKDEFIAFCRLIVSRFPDR